MSRQRFQKKIVINSDGLGHLYILIIATFFCHLGCTSFSKRDVATAVSIVKSKSHDIYFSGSRTDVQHNVESAILLSGGGDGDNGSMDWFLQQGKFGDVVVLRGSGADGYNQYLIEKGANSVTSIVIKTPAAASDLSVLNKVRSAELIFFAGGDQSDYARNLACTPLAREIETSTKRGASIGGNSAGLAILGEFYFPAYRDTITSNQTLSNPQHERLLLDRDLLHLPHLENVITDSHFRNRDRMGRLLTFMARIQCDKWSSDIRGVGLDETVAIGIRRSGMATVFSKTGMAYLLESRTAPTSCQTSRPLTFKNVVVRKLKSGETFDFNNWNISTASTYGLDVVDGVIHSSIGSIY